MSDLAIQVLIWMGVAAIAFLIWLLVESALTMRKTRRAVAELTTRVEPTLAHIEQITSSLEPAIARLDPLVEHAALTVDAVNLELMRVDQILEDVNNVTESVGAAVDKVASVTNAPLNFVSDMADKMRGLFSGKENTGKARAALKQSQAAALKRAQSLEAASKAGDGEPSENTTVGRSPSAAARFFTLPDND